MNLTHGFDPYVGAQIAGYTLETLVGRGGMSVVYRAEQRQLGRKVAIKLLTPDLARDERFRQRFVRESRLAASLDHPNIIPIYDAGEAEGLLYIAMRFVEGCTLAQFIERHGRLAPSQALSILEQIGGALDVAHSAGLVHRDVKPENILIAEKAGAFDRIFLSDFGLTKRPNTAGPTRSGELMGTVGYVAPEQIEGKPLDGRSDVYSLGCVLYQCLTGHQPFESETDVGVLWAHLNDEVPLISRMRAELPQAMDQVIQKALAKDPKNRYESAGDLTAATRHVLEHRTSLEAASKTPEQGQDGVLGTSEQTRDEMVTQQLLVARRPDRTFRMRWLWAGFSLLVIVGVAVSIARLMASDAGPSGRANSFLGPSQASAQKPGEKLPTYPMNRSPNSTRYRNPIVVYNAPDPAAIAAGGRFYAYTTQSAYLDKVHIPVLVSDDLIGWGFLGDALPTLPEWADTSDTGDTWAPDVIRIQDSYLMYFAIRKRTHAMVIALATSATPEGPFHVVGGPLVDVPGSIDPFVFQRRNGELLMYSSSIQGPIQVQRLSRDGRRIVGSPQPLLEPSPASAYETLVEGVAVIRHAGFYFLFYSGDDCCGDDAHYAVLVARSRSPFGPFERAPTNPIVESNSHFNAPGHASVFRDSSGAYFLLYHALMRSDPVLSRNLMLDRMRWLAGWPVVNGGNGPTSTPQPRPKVAI